MTLGEPLRSTDGYDPIGMSQREIRLAMLANGYEPLPLIGKAPIPKKWEQIVINEEMIHGWVNAGPNTGMRAATAPVLDIDILDEQAAQIVEATARLYLEDKGEILIRIGRPPKRAILLSTDKPFKKIIRKLAAPDGKVHRFEVLGDGQQLAVAGTHPDTREPYVWKGGRSPVNTPRVELPPVDEDEIRTILDLCAGELKAKLGWGELDVAPAADTNEYEASATHTPISERVERIQYGGEYPINDTLLVYTGEQLRNGVPSDDLINDCRARVRKAYDDIPGDPQERRSGTGQGYTTRSTRWFMAISKRTTRMSRASSRRFRPECSRSGEKLKSLVGHRLLGSAATGAWKIRGRRKRFRRWTRRRLPPRNSSDTSPRMSSCPSRRLTWHHCLAGGGS